MASKRKSSGQTYWVAGCMIRDDGSVAPGARLFTTALAARRHVSHAPCGAKAVRVRVSREAPRG